MANVLVEEQYLQNIANAIRNKNASSDKYTPSQMAQAINDIPQSGSGLNQITQSGDVVTIPNGFCALTTKREVTVNRSQFLNLL